MNRWIEPTRKFVKEANEAKNIAVVKSLKEVSQFVGKISLDINSFARKYIAAAKYFSHSFRLLERTAASTVKISTGTGFNRLIFWLNIWENYAQALASARRNPPREILYFRLCRRGRNRTYANGFGDRSTTIIRRAHDDFDLHHTQKIPKKQAPR